MILFVGDQILNKFFYVKNIIFNVFALHYMLYTAFFYIF